MISGKEEFFQLIEEGRKGNNIGLTIGSSKLETYMDGFLPGTSYLIGGMSGVSKSTYMQFAFIYKPLMQFLSGEHIERDPYYCIFNLEMTRSQIYAKLLSMYIFDKYGEQIRFKEMFSRGKDTILSDEHYNLIKKCKDFIDILDQRIVCYDGSLNEEKYLKTMTKELKRFGTFTDDGYIPNNPQQIFGVIIDHMSLIKASSGRSKKDEMDAISRASVMLRNTTKIMSPIHVAQFNRGSGSDERLKQSLQEPTFNDFKDTNSLVEDSQVIIALHSPHKFKQVTYKKYDIKTLEQNFLAIFLLKSRFGTSDIMVPCGFYGDCSYYLELPRPDEIYSYETYKTPYWISNNNKDDIKQEIKEDNENIVKSNFIL